MTLLPLPGEIDRANVALAIVRLDAIIKTAKEINVIVARQRHLDVEHAKEWTAPPICGPEKTE